MKKSNLLFLASALLIMLALAVSSCTKEGPAGADGTDGVNGTDGTDGVDGNVVCMTCHNLENKATKEMQYAQSGHAAGAVVGYAGGRQNCARCHSNEGFIETQFTGMDTTAAEIPIPTPIGCVTCHDFHDTFDFENEGPDYALRTTKPVDLIMYDGEVTLDFGGPSNLCATCHQPRTASPEDDGSGNFTITSTYWGSHHGPQSTSIEGIGGYEVGTGYPTPGSTTHKTEVTCIGCHMHESTGHTWNVDVAACTSCHSDATDFNINGVQTDVQNMMAELKTKFIAAGMWDETEDKIVPGTYPIDHVGAYYNYAWILDDRSDGVHNAAYIKTLLTNSIAVFN
ncbi:MAG: hypothetical protein GXO89_13090 [Chlorobi bacterium]|nr:hypothetical protein [Chlorobiota bacterium]